MEIVWSKKFIRKTEEIAPFIAKDSPTFAVDFIDQLIQSVEKLKKFPFSGSVLPENMAFRQVAFQSYRVVYRITDRLIQIVTIISPGFTSDTSLKR